MYSQRNYHQGLSGKKLKSFRSLNRLPCHNSSRDEDRPSPDCLILRSNNDPKPPVLESSQPRFMASPAKQIFIQRTRPKKISYARKPIQKEAQVAEPKVRTVAEESPQRVRLCSLFDDETTTETDEDGFSQWRNDLSAFGPET